MRTNNTGFTFVELLVVLLIMSVIMSAILGAFVTQNQAGIEQDRISAMQQDLRIAMNILTDNMRNAGYGVPDNYLNNWITWEEGFSTTPLLFDTTETGPRIRIAMCTSNPIATVATASTIGATQLTVDSIDNFSTDRTDLIWIGRSEFALVTGKSESTITVDTNAMSSGNQSLGKAWAVGTPICRVDVVTFTVHESQDPSMSYLTLDQGNGTGESTFATGISNLNVATVAAGERYQVTLTGAAKAQDGTYIYRSLSSDIAVVN